MTDEHQGPLLLRRVRVGPVAVDVRSTEPRHGRPIVLVHGIGVSGAYFLPFARILARHHEVHLLDLPGYGSTPKPPHPLDVPELAQVAAESVTQLGLAEPILVGQSMGCQVVVDAIVGHPGLAGGYILIGPTIEAGARSLRVQAFRLGRDMLRETAANNLLILRDYARMGPVRYLRTSRFMLADRIDDHIVNCAMPGLIVRGARDPIAPGRWIHQLAQLAPDAYTAEVPGAAHNCQHTHPRELASACAPFLSRFAAS